MTGVIHTDNELLALLSQDDRNAFESLYKRYWPTLYDTAHQRLKNNQQAEDIVQDIFIDLWNRRARLTIANLAAYLHTAVRFRVFNYVHRDLAAESFYEPFETMATYYTGADGQLLEKEMMRLVRAYAETLPEKRRKIFLMHLTGNLSTREIAEQLRVSQKTVQNQLGNALHGLRTHIIPTLLLLLSVLG
ncbi:MAG: RNA polymerase sigma-70 factor [Puia sp.]|nr:RNA polymerase sigma-70 factor [Puia sp.]